MRVTCDPLAADGSAAGDQLPLAAAVPIAPLWTQRLRWQCRERLLDLQVIFAEPLALPSSEPSEPVEGALARVCRAVAGTGALVLLRNPAQAFGTGRIAFADGARLLGIASEADEACWDAVLSLGRPIYGVRGTLACEVMSAHPASVLSALAYGMFVCEEGMTLRSLVEDRSQVSWDAGRADATAAVIIRDGFEAAQVSGASGQWRDQGPEGYVRVVIRAGQGTCWTQPRFLAGRPPASAPPP
jgi:hypothetical protein